MLLLRPKHGLLDPLPVDAAEFFTPAQIERAEGYRSPQLALYVSALALEAGAVAVAEPLGVADEVAEVILARYAVGAVDLVPMDALFADV